MVNTDLILQWSRLIPFSDGDIKNASVQNVEGVFRISKKEADGKFYVVFVGNAINLQEKLLEILSTAEFLKQSAVFSFRYAPVKGEEVRKAIEKQMYRQYAPKYNPIEPNSPLEIKVNTN